MNTELEVLKKIFQAKNGIPIKLISNHLGFGVDYIRFICKRLMERGLIKEVERNWYKITQKGKKELERRGLIKIPFLKKGLKMKKAIWKAVRMKDVPVVSKNIKLKSEFGEPKAEKLKLGQKIEKVAAFLRNFRRV